MKTQKNARDQAKLYNPLKKWMESRGFKCWIVGNKSPSLIIPIWDIFPQRYFIPDLIGLKENRVMIVEAETKRDLLLEKIGKSMIWKMMATFVCIAYPEEKCEILKAGREIFKRLGLGLLSVSEEGVKEVVDIVETDLFSLTELHPLDPKKEQDLAERLKKISN